jgi:hypothetical protein
LITQLDFVYTSSIRQKSRKTHQKPAAKSPYNTMGFAEPFNPIKHQQEKTSTG